MEELWPEWIGKTLLSKHKITGDWIVTVQDDDWEFTVIRNLEKGGHIEAWSYKEGYTRTHVSIVQEDFPINESIGKILLWMEKHMEKEKKNFVPRLDELAFRAMLVVAAAAVLGAVIWMMSTG